jgi:copper chaperone CopZ
MTTIAVVSILGFVGSAQAPAQQTTVLKVSGMACGECAKTVEKEAKKIEGVVAAVVDQPKGEAKITYEPTKVTEDVIVKRLRKNTRFEIEAQGERK